MWKNLNDLLEERPPRERPYGTVISSDNYDLLAEVEIQLQALHKDTDNKLDRIIELLSTRDKEKKGE